MISAAKITIVDADGLIALFHKDDRHSETALSLLEKLYQLEVKLLHPATMVVEAITTLQRKLNQPELAAQIVKLVEMSELPIEPVDETVLKDAVNFFQSGGSKKNTFFDSVVAALARRHEATAIFSFDEWYQKQGFTLATDLF